MCKTLRPEPVPPSPQTRCPSLPAHALCATGKVSKERALSEIGILFVEGFETTGHTISWTLLQVVTHPGVNGVWGVKGVEGEKKLVGREGGGGKRQVTQLDPAAGCHAPRCGRSVGFVGLDVPRKELRAMVRRDAGGEHV